MNNFELISAISYIIHELRLPGSKVLTDEFKESLDMLMEEVMGDIEDE